MHNANSFDLVTFIFGQIGFDLVWIRAAAPIAFNKLRTDTQLFSQLFPQCRKMPRLEHQHAITWRQRVDQCRLPRASAGRRIDERMLLRLEDTLDPVERLHANRCKIRTTVVDCLLSNRA